MLGIFLLILFCCVTLFYIKWYPVKQYWANLGIPHSPPNPFLGSLTFLLRQNPSIWMRNTYKHFKTPYIGMWLFWRPALIVNSPEIARNILIKDSANFRNHFLKSGTTDSFGSHNLLLIKDPTWTKLRKHLAAAFTSAKLKSSFNMTRFKSKELVQRIVQQDGYIKDLRMLFTDYTTDVVGVTSFEVVSDATLTGEGALRSITKSLMKFDVWRGLCWCSIFFWPELVDIFRFSFTPKSTNDYFKSVFQMILSQHENEKQSSHTKSVMDVLIDLKNKNIIDDEAPIEEFIASQASVLLIGGFDTTGSMLTFILFELAFHQEEQDHLYKELLEAQGKHGDEFTNYEHIQELTYLDCVIKETLRIRGPMSWLDREALNDYKVDDHLTIKAGTPVYVNAVGMHFDPEYFPEPEKYNPERFLPENESKIKPFTFLPFGEGPRMCIGFRSAQLTIKSAISMILIHNKVMPTPNCPTPSNLKIENKGLFYVPGEPISLQFIPRKVMN